MSNPGTLFRNTASFTAGAAQFGSAGLASGVYQLPLAVDSFVSTTGASGGNLNNAFTLEAFVATTATSIRVLAGHDNWYWVGITAAGIPTVHYGASASEATIAGSSAINNGAKHHIAFVIDTTSVRLYADGQMVGSSTTYKTAGTSNSNNLFIGGFNPSSSPTIYDWASSGSGTIDEFRVSNVARYTGSSYTVPTSAFTSDGNTYGLYHLETDASDSSNASSLIPYNGTVTRNTATYAAGKFNNAESGAVAYFGSASANPVTSIITPVPGSSGGQITGTGTIECWIKTSTSGSTRVALSQNYGFWIGINSDGTATAHIGNGSTTPANEHVLSSSVTVNDSAWHHVALVVNAGIASFYVDGARAFLDSSKSSTLGSSPADTFAIGGFNNASVQMYDWQGSIDEVAVWSTARYSAASYTVPTTAYAGTESGLLNLYHLDSNFTDSATGTTGPTIGTISVSTANGNDTITYPAPVATINPVAGVSLYRGTSSGAESATALLTNTGTTSGSFVTATPSSGQYFYYVKAFDNAATPAYSAQSNEVSTGTAVTTAILLNDSNIYYSPGNWDVTSTRAKTINAGAYLRTMIVGNATTMTVAFDLTGVAAPYPQIIVKVDELVVFTGAIASTVNVSIPSTTTWTKHVLEIIVKSTTETQSRWSTQATAVAITSISVNTTGATTASVQARGTLLGLAFGDSITEGVRTLGQTQTNDTDRNDSSVGWAYNLTRTLGCEIGVIGFGATGLLASGSGGVPAVTTSYNLLWGSGPSRTFSGLDFIVINEGTNDGSSNTTTAATTLLNGLLAALPAKTIIIVLRPFNGTAQASYLQAAIAACSAPKRVAYVDTAGWLTTADTDTIGLHPLGYINTTKISPLVASAIRTALNRGATYIYTGTAAKQVSPVRY